MTGKRVGIIVKGTFEVDPADQSRLVELIREHLDQTRRTTPGCIDYRLAVDMEHPRVVHLIEAWQDQSSLDAHLSSLGLQAARSRMATVEIRNYRTSLYSVSAEIPYRREDMEAG